MLSSVGRYTLTAIDGTVSAGSTSFLVGQGANSITITSAAPTNAVVNGTYSPTATVTSGDTPVVTSATTGVCTVAAGVVTEKTTGTCTLNFNDTGNANYVAASQVQQSFKIYSVANSITITSTAPGSPAVNGTYTPTATAKSGDTPVITIDASSSSVCSISSGVVQFLASGSCTIDFNDAGNTNYGAAPQVQQIVSVGKAANSITITTTAPNNAVVSGTYSPAATATSGDTVAITVDASSASVCSISSGVVTFNAIGNCTLNFNDPASTNYLAANQQQQVVAVGTQLNAPSGVTLGYGSSAGSLTVTFTGSSNAPGGQLYTALACTNTGMTANCVGRPPSPPVPL